MVFLVFLSLLTLIEIATNSMTPQQLAQQMLGQVSNQTPIVQLKPKPIFIIRVPTNMTSTEIASIRDAISKDTITDDYHVLVIPTQQDEYSFEMYNADKIETQKWNELVNRILK